VQNICSCSTVFKIVSWQRGISHFYVPLAGPLLQNENTSAHVTSK